MSSLPSSHIDLDVARLVLDVVQRKVRGLDTRVQNSIVGGEIERTTEGASTLTVTLHDPRNTLLQSGMFEYAIDTRLDSLFFRLVKVGKVADELTLTFEDREVALLRAKKGARKASRSKMTRAEFALSLVREVRPRIPFVCPQLHERQPVAGTTDVRKTRKALPFQFQRGTTDGKPENSWDCLQRLAREVGWRCFLSAGSLYFVNDDDLLAEKVAMTLNEQSRGVVSIDFDLDAGKRSDEATLTARAARWAAAPGAVVKLTDLGPANGLWLVHDLRRGLYSPDAQITLRRAAKPLPEPAPALKVTSPTAISTGGKITASKTGTTASAAVERAYAAAKAIDAQRYPYVWGGGHGAAGVPSGSGALIGPPAPGQVDARGYDCSGSVCAVLAAGGLGFRQGGPAAVSGALMSWGAAGEGHYLTVWSSLIHTFIVFHTDKGDRHFGTGRWGKSWGGAGFNPQLHPTSGFTARHWPGT